MARSDFNGDGRTDILWLLKGSQAVSNWLATPSGGFTVNDTNALTMLDAENNFQFITSGDFDGDGRTDLLWRFNKENDYGVWATAANGGFTSSVPGARFTVEDDSWSIIGSGDFNGDGVDDLLWRHQDGALSNWLGTKGGGFSINDANALVQVPNDWQVAGTGDFNGDGRTDLFWRNSNGMISNWLSTESGGHFINDEYGLLNFGDDPLYIGDFNADGDDDLLWRTDRGELILTPGSDGYFDFHLGSGFVTSVSPDWQIEGVGDFNGDGADDLFWRNDNGTVSNWLGHATPFGAAFQFTINDANALTPVSIDWQTPDSIWL